MSEFTDLKTNIDGVLAGLQTVISNFSEFSAAQQSTKSRNIENDIGKIEDDLKEVESNLVMWEDSVKSDARRYIQSVNAQLTTLKDKYQQEKKKGDQRAQLLGSAGNVGVSSDSSKQSLVDQREEINKGDKLISQLNQGVADAKDTGLAIIDNIHKQNAVIDHIDGNMQQLDVDAETGGRLVDTMICRNKRRTVVISVVIVVLAVAIGFFIYYMVTKSSK